jgi:hypothetical protein
MNPALEYLFSLIPAIPILAVALTGIILAVIRRSYQRTASRLVIAGLSALSVNVLASAAVHVYAHQSFDKYQDATVHAKHLLEMNAALYALNIAGVALITAAVFASRALGRPARLTNGSSDRGASSPVGQGGSR